MKTKPARFKCVPCGAVHLDKSVGAGGFSDVGYDRANRILGDLGWRIALRAGKPSSVPGYTPGGGHCLHCPECAKKVAPDERRPIEGEYLRGGVIKP